MKSTADKLIVTYYNIDGFLKLSEAHSKSGGFQYILQKNQVAFNTQWKIGIGVDIVFLQINSMYQPENTLDLSNLATYTATQNYTFTEVGNLANEKEELSKVTETFHNEISKEYNNRLKGTKIQVPFRITDQQKLDQFRQRLSAPLHKSLERLRNIQ